MNVLLVFESMFGNTRDVARQAQGELVSPTTGIREWLDQLPPAGERIAAACFDTKSASPRLPGSAAKAAERRLRQHGFVMVAPPRTFWVHGSRGPLVDGQLALARAWGAELVRTGRTQKPASSR